MWYQIEFFAFCVLRISSLIVHSHKCSKSLSLKNASQKIKNHCSATMLTHKKKQGCVSCVFGMTRTKIRFLLNVLKMCNRSLSNDVECRLKKQAQVPFLGLCRMNSVRLLSMTCEIQFNLSFLYLSKQLLQQKCIGRQISTISVVDSRIDFK